MSKLIRSRKTRLSAVLATAAVSMGILAGPAAAHNTGLVVVDIDRTLNNNNVAVSVPVTAAANICGNVDILTAQVGQVVACEADANGSSEVRQGRPGNRNQP